MRNRAIAVLGMLFPLPAAAGNAFEGMIPETGAGHESSPIINGDIADDSDYPMTGALVFVGGFSAVLCSSTLIAPDVLILAAHCVEPEALASFGYSGGALWWSPEPDLAMFDASGSPPLPEDAVLVKAAVSPEEFSLGAMLKNETALNYDIAVAFLETPQEQTPLGVLPMSDEASAIEAGVAVSIVGWGQTSEGGPAGIKYWGESVIGAVSDYEFQVGPGYDDVRQCHGDSGGPTFMAVETGSAEKERVIGVTSHTWDATDCASVGAVETRVDYYLDWIDDAMQDACADGTRTWCDEETGILPPPLGIRTTSATIGNGIRVAPVCGTVGSRSGGALAAFALALGFTRRRRNPTR